jgi:hypothetical protein
MNHPLQTLLTEQVKDPQQVFRFPREVAMVVQLPLLLLVQLLEQLPVR